MSILKCKQNFRVLFYRFLVLISILVILNILGSVVHTINGHMNYNLYLYEIENFAKHKDDFTTLAKQFAERFENDFSTNNNLSHILISVLGEKLCITYIYKDDSPPYDIMEPVEDNTKIAFESLIHTAFTKRLENGFSGSFDGVRISREQVAFTTNGP